MRKLQFTETLNRLRFIINVDAHALANAKDLPAAACAQCPSQASVTNAEINASKAYLPIFPERNVATASCHVREQTKKRGRS